VNTLAFSYLDETNVFQAFKDSEKYMRPLFEPFSEFERIARNKPHAGIDKAYPKVTDGTTASVIEKTPRRILQQIPSGLVHSNDDEWIDHVANFILKETIIPNANGQFTFLQKAQIAISKSLTYGAQPAYFPFVNRGKYFGPDMVLPYIKDVFLEPGKVSDTDSNFILMRSWYQPRDIEAIIAREQKLSSKAADRGENYESGWDLQALADIKDMMSQKDDLSTTPNERDKNNRNGGIEIIHCFQRGIGAKFYSIHMKTKKIVRTRVNKDPRGELPINYLYATADISNPLGRGFVEMVGAMQNLMDSEVQMYQYNRALMLNPPMVKRGNWNKNQAKLAPNVLVDLGNDASAIWEPVKIDSVALTQFSTNYSLMQSQMYQLLSAPVSNIPAQTGSTTQSKTPQGVQQQNQNLNVDDTFIRNQAEAWLGKSFATMVNIYFSERTGVDEIQLDQDTANDLRNLKNFDPSMLSPDNKIRIDFDTETKEMDFIVDAGSSEKQDDSEELAQLQAIIADVNQNPYSLEYVQQAGKVLNLGEVYKQMFFKLGLKEIDKILTEVPTGPDGQKITTPPMAMDRPKLNAKYEDLPPAAQVQFLQNAGIQVTIQDVMQTPVVDPNVHGQAAVIANSEAQGSAIDNHPLVKLMTTLQIKFADLPEDSKQQLLAELSIPSNMATPVQNDQAMKAIQLAHTINSSNDQSAAGQNQPTDQSGAQSPQSQSTDASQPPQQPQDTQQAPQAQQSIAPPMPSDNLTPDDHKYLEELLKMGLNPQQAGQALALIHHGYPVEDVIKKLGVSA
jgi:hypothetical protein